MTKPNDDEVQATATDASATPLDAVAEGDVLDVLDLIVGDDVPVADGASPVETDSAPPLNQGPTTQPLAAQPLSELTIKPGEPVATQNFLPAQAHMSPQGAVAALQIVDPATPLPLAPPAQQGQNAPQVISTTSVLVPKTRR